MLNRKFDVGELYTRLAQMEVPIVTPGNSCINCKKSMRCDDGKDYTTDDNLFCLQPFENTEGFVLQLDSLGRVSPIQSLPLAKEVRNGKNVCSYWEQFSNEDEE